MNYYAIIEPLVSNKYWSNQYTEGMKQEIGRVKGTYVEVTLDELDQICEYNRLEGTRPTVLVNCISKKWLPGCIELLEKKKIHPLLLTPVNQKNHTIASSVSFDFFGVFHNLCTYLDSTGHGKIALVGLNPSSTNDVVKRSAFNKYYESKGEKGNSHIFWNRGVLEECCLNLYEKIAEYNSVICTNDIVAVKLIRFLKQNHIDVPKDIYLAAMGNTTISELITPKITVAKFDCNSIGQHAARLYRFLVKNPNMSSITANVSGQIIARESTGEIPPSRLPRSMGDDAEYVNFYEDDDVRNILALEQLFQKADEVDQHIIQGILYGRTYSSLSESLFISESAIKYRVKKMIEITACSTKEDLLNLLELYIDF